MADSSVQQQGLSLLESIFQLKSNELKSFKSVNYKLYGIFIPIKTQITHRTRSNHAPQQGSIIITTAVWFA
jgi:hypothetical protein